MWLLRVYGAKLVLTFAALFDRAYGAGLDHRLQLRSVPLHRVCLREALPQTAHHKHRVSSGKKRLLTKIELLLLSLQRGYADGIC